MSLLIKNAMIINADKREKQAKDIFIDKGIIKKIGPALKVSAKKTIDAKGLLVLPGLIDIHVHFREPGQEYKETIETGSRAAVKGGFTGVMCMPNTRPVIDNAMIVEAIKKEAERVGLCNVIPIGSITRGQKDAQLVDMFEMKEAGCLALSDDGKSVENSQLMRRALEYSKMVDILLIQHCEDPLISAGGAMNEGITSTLLGIKADPYISESIIVARDIELVHFLGGHIHFAHMSCRRSIELIRQAKAQGISVTAEACPHHFALTDEVVKSFDTNTKMNPPLRTADDVEAIKEGLKDGTIDLIVTDHAPHSQEDKEVEFECAPFGIIGLETSLALTITELIKPGILTWEQVVDKMSTAQAKISKMKNKGILKEGFDADITIVDPDEEWVITKEDTVSKSKNSPFFGTTVTGRVKTTIYGGKIVFEDQ
ncbi:MAG: dihydroorotase [Candidatus Omnitrophica bacterium]|nr:dihydroorotase [Candidatus Omnitrophota bacterium]